MSEVESVALCVVAQWRLFSVWRKELYMHFGFYLTHGLVEKERLADVLDFRDCAFEVKGFREDDFEDLIC